MNLISYLEPQKSTIKQLKPPILIKLCPKRKKYKASNYKKKPVQHPI
jgi:hypothetical protein